MTCLEATIAPSPLERWFTTHPAPLAHSLAGTSAGAPAWEALEAYLPTAWRQGIDLGYAEPEGDPALREAVAAEFGLGDRHHVLLTQGAVEANWLALAALVRPGTRAIIQTPIYPQLPCLARGLGALVTEWRVPADPDTPADLAQLWALLAQGADVLVLNTPHNPTGRVFDAEALAEIVARARAAGCVLLVDEVYRGVGDAPMPPSALAWGPAGVLVSGSLSKACALPGLRVGWLAGDPGVLDATLPWREHTTLALAGPATALALALWARREELAAANRALLVSNRAIVREWLADLPGWQGRAPATAGVLLCGPVAGADDVQLADTWYQRERGLVIPAAVCGYPGRFRLGFGHRDPAALRAALASFAATVAAPLARA